MPSKIIYKLYKIMKMKINMVCLLFIYLFVGKFNCLEYLVNSGIWFIYF